jgi:hypothetical protein
MKAYIRNANGDPDELYEVREATEQEKARFIEAIRPVLVFGVQQLAVAPELTNVTFFPAAQVIAHDHSRTAYHFPAGSSVVLLISDEEYLAVLAAWQAYRPRTDRIESTGWLTDDADADGLVWTERQPDGTIKRTYAG